MAFVRARLAVAVQVLGDGRHYPGRNVDVCRSYKVTAVGKFPVRVHFLREDASGEAVGDCAGGSSQLLMDVELWAVPNSYETSRKFDDACVRAVFEGRGYLVSSK